MLRRRRFLVNSAKFKNSCLEEHLQTVASEKIYNYRSITVENALPNFFNFLWIFPRFKDSKELEETLAKKVLAFNLIPCLKLMWSASFMSLNAILWLLLLSHFLSLKGFLSSWRLYHLVVFIAVLLDKRTLL